MVSVVSEVTGFVVGLRAWLGLGPAELEELELEELELEELELEELEAEVCSS